MADNPYEAPKQPESPRRSWRKLWKGLCLGSLLFVAICFVAGKVMAATWLAGGDPHPVFLIIDALLAAGELFGWTLVALSGIAWFLTRRT